MTRRKDVASHLTLFQEPVSTSGGAAPGVFDPARLTQARRLAAMTKKGAAEALKVSAVAVGQWESGSHPPRPDHLRRLAELFDLPPEFFIAGRPYARLEGSAAHFRSLRRTPARERERALAFTEQVWELTHALERLVQIPPVDLPGFSAGEIDQSIMPCDPVKAARELRQRWGLPPGRIPRMVRLLEQHGIIVTLTPFAGDATASVDAFSTSHLPRPIIVLTPDRADDVYRHRFTAAHELGHLILHGDAEPGDAEQERQADQFAAEFLTPSAEVHPLLPRRMDLNALAKLSAEWGVSVSSMIYRCREVGLISEAAYRRAFQRHSQLAGLGLFHPQPVADYPGEVPKLLTAAVALAGQHGVTLGDLADELRLSPQRIRNLVGWRDEKPVLRLVD
ncbi:XRE family transcriptional regulator [Nocardioides caldifontis]|uniref:XRE family transcriptional regulator n=1 Tax=Nocardioides caldifontis TaxID=2588938 RepID=UPI00193A6088|nr:XRE family transcriptional regulator [Nocardioides caldifontis]